MWGVGQNLLDDLHSCTDDVNQMNANTILWKLHNPFLKLRPTYLCAAQCHIMVEIQLSQMSMAKLTTEFSCKHI